MLKIKNIAVIGTIAIIHVNIDKRASHIICNLNYSVSKEIPIVFLNGSNYDYHFILKELAKEF